MKFVKFLRELSKKDLAIAGGKGANLAEMYNIGLPVPNAFVVTAQAYKYFLEKTKIGQTIFEILKNTDVNDNEQLQRNTRRIRELIEKTKMPEEIEKEIEEAYSKLSKEYGVKEEWVVARSSATAEDLPNASFAGLQLTVLNIKGAKNVVKAVKQCWASLFTARATFYRASKGFDHSKVLIAVPVQKQLDSDKAGVGFTIHPSTGEKDKIMIEGSWGQGESVVSGAVTPDTYVLDKKTGEVLEKHIATKLEMRVLDKKKGGVKVLKVPKNMQNKRVLNDDELKQLHKLALKLEKHYKVPQDFEWVVEKGKVYLVQARPVTVFYEKREGVEVEEKVKPILEGLPASPGIAQGVVKIVKSPKELGKIKQGDILVTRMTNPDYVAGMKRAVGIITDEGGQTCFVGDTLVLTNKGFMRIEDVYERFFNGENLFVFSYDYKNKKPVWKRIINAGKRLSKVIRVSVSQTGRIKENYIDVTPDHKMYTFENRKMIKKSIEKIIKDEESVLLVESLPKNDIELDNHKLAYLVGAIASDGCIRLNRGSSGNYRRGAVVFTQKNDESKIDFIEAVKGYYNEIFGFEMKGREKYSSSLIKNKLVKSKAKAFDFISSKLIPAKLFEKIMNKMDLWALLLSDESALNFLAGIIDGDGCFYGNRIHVYVSEENVLKAVVISCLKLGIVPQITRNRGIYHVQIVERIYDIIERTKRVKGLVGKRRFGTRFFAARQILQDVVDKVNYKGRIKPYIKYNLLIDAEKIVERILPLADEKLKKELIEVLSSSVRMQRVKFVENLGEKFVFNIEVESDDEMEKNYIVFTKRYTPILVSNSHAAIVSRELGIPCVVGTKQATKKLKDGNLVTIDGYNGKVYLGKVEIRKQEEKYEYVKTKTKVYINLGEPDLAERYKDLKCDGVGLMRAEFMASEVGKHPKLLIKRGGEELFINTFAKGIEKVAKAFYPRPVVYRALDFKTNEYADLAGGKRFEPHENNPMIGWRGASRYITEPEIFELELKAIKKVRDKGYDNVYLMIPFVRTTWELDEIKKIIDKVGLRKDKKFKLWIMVEVPSAAILIEEFCKKGIDGVSIGSNDLTQLILGVDRDSAILGKRWFNELDPAVLWAIERVVKTCKKYGVTCSICGQAPSVYPELTRMLVKWGITSVSVNPDVVDKTRHIVAEAEKGLLHKLLKK